MVSSQAEEPQQLPVVAAVLNNFHGCRGDLGLGPLCSDNFSLAVALDEYSELH
jgi:hypothetical protein